jgi:tetratricopeptide (TPR) repeat protein
MDRREEQLAVIDRHDALYQPRLDHRRIWALMKLHRFDEAIRIANKVALSSDIFRRISGFNGLIAIELERQRPEACFRAGKRGIQATGSRSCILLHNTAEAAFAVFNFKEAERLALSALKAPFEDCPNSSYNHLASLYLLQGDLSRAMEATRSARQQGIRRRYRQQFEMENTSWLHRLLYVLGKFEKAHELGERRMRAPDRVGMTSLSREVTRLAAIVEHHASLRAFQQALRERASARTLGKRSRTWLTLRRLDQQAWVIRRRASRLVSGRPSLLVDIVRPYFTPVLPWIAGDVIPLTGGGVVLQALKQARGKERLKKKTAPYFNGLEGEVAYRSGDMRRALALGQKALARLPREEVLLRGRIAAWTADANRRLGRNEQAHTLLHQALQHFPTVLRIFGIRLPARVVGGTDPLSRQVARALLRSPLLDVMESGYTLRVTAQGKQVRICLEGHSGQRYACASKDLAKVEDEKQRVAQAVDLFHDKIFAPRIDLTQRDINSLDGSAVRGDADQLIERVLGK